MNQARVHFPRYIGSGQYCYANSLAMVLQHLGNSYDPGYLECLTSGSVSAFWTKDGLPFFSSFVNPPDVGVSVALNHLGYTYDHHYGKPEEVLDPIKRLQGMLSYGPVLVGPVDMGELVYLPNHTYLKGVDHYIVVFSVDESYVYLHDPAGYPYMNLHLDAFLKAWEAKTIAYRTGSYSMWGNIRRVHIPSEDEIFSRTDRQIAKNIQLEKECSDNILVGPLAIRKLAEQMKEKRLSPALKSHLLYFSFQLGARRCSDYAVFYDKHDAVRSALKEQQGFYFGKAHTALGKMSWEELYTALMKIVEIEEEFQEVTLRVIFP